MNNPQRILSHKENKMMVAHSQRKEKKKDTICKFTENKEIALFSIAVLISCFQFSVEAYEINH